jgi:hypothetical protein
MRRKLIKQDAFDRITNESVTTAERELVEAAPILAHALGKGPMALHCFNESTAVFKTDKDTYVHAGYGIKNEAIDFTNIEELVIEESTRKDKMRSTLSEMIDSVLQDDHAKAEDLFENYLGMVRWSEFKENSQRKSVKKESKDNRSEVFKAAKAAGLHEVYKVAQDVLGYVDFMKNGPALAEAVSKTDEKGNITDLRLPTLNERNSDRIQRLGYRVTNSKLHGTRESVPEVVQEQEFCKAVANLKRQNAFSDQEALEEALDHIVKSYPDLICVTQEELSQMVGEALETAGVNNYDDQITAFMAEGILRKAHGVYAERVAQILHMAGAPKCESEDTYAHFQAVVERFYPALDEKFGLERKAFSDLYEALSVIYKGAERKGDSELVHETASYINELASILNGEIKPDIQVAEEAAQWLDRFVEANVEGSKESWNVSNKPHLTVSGDHPQMAKNAKVPAVSGRHTDGWGDQAPAIGQDNHNYKSGKNAKTMRHSSWGQEGGGEVFPKLKNPYVPKPFGDYTMKGEKGVDKEATGQHHSTWQSSDTWPALQNPYVPKEAGGEGGKGHKMKDGKETDLVVDR